MTWYTAILTQGCSGLPGLFHIFTTIISYDTNIDQCPVWMERDPSDHLGKADSCLSWRWQWRDCPRNTSCRPSQWAPPWWRPASTSCCRWRTWSPPPPPGSRGRTRAGCRPPGRRTPPSPWDGDGQAVWSTSTSTTIGRGMSRLGFRVLLHTPSFMVVFYLLLAGSLWHKS